MSQPDHGTIQDAAPLQRSISDHHVTVTPLDMRQARFGSAMRGFDRAEVAAFLQEAAAGFENALRENERLRQQIAGLEASIASFRALETSLKNTLMSAQKVADDMRENARQEAARIVREAEARAELVAQAAGQRVEAVQRDVDALRLKRREVRANLEACISSLQASIDFMREQEQRENAG